MNTYQKVIACVFRVMGVFVSSYAVVTLISLTVMTGNLLASLMSIPALVLGLGFFFGAVPLTKIVTQGIADD